MKIMSSSYTKLLKQEIIREWIGGKHRDKIANENGLSAGTVSNIIKEWREEIGNLAGDEVREFGVILRKTDITPLQCARGFRIINILHNLGFTEDDLEQFVQNTYKTCKSIGLQPDKIALHIDELIGLTEKVPLGEVSNYIHRNRALVEDSSRKLEMSTTQLEDAQANLDNAFSKYKTDISEARWIYWFKRELAERGLGFNSISALVNTIEDIQILGYDANKIIAKFSDIVDLESRKKYS